MEGQWKAREKGNGSFEAGEAARASVQRRLLEQGHGRGALKHIEATRGKVALGHLKSVEIGGGQCEATDHGGSRQRSAQPPPRRSRGSLRSGRTQICG